VHGQGTGLAAARNVSGIDDKLLSFAVDKGMKIT
jgi:hypothetical protein